MSGPLVLVVDDDPSVRKALRRLLKSGGFQVSEFASAEECLRQSNPDNTVCAILDVGLPGLNGLDLQRMLAEKNFNLPIVFITGRGDIPMAVRAMKTGAVDFLPKPFDNGDLLAIVQKAADRFAKNKRAQAGLTDIRRRADSLSPREREVMNLVVKGMINKQSGSKLGVTEKTIKVHRARVMHKMGARSIPELVHMADQLHLR
jgi:FixJ family two-component response regulator